MADASDERMGAGGATCAQMPRKIAQIERLEPHLETQMQMTARNRGRPSASRRKLLPSASSSAFIRGIPGECDRRLGSRLDSFPE